MTAIASHSPLERFLLFETIQSFDNTAPSFTTLSESLKSHEALRERENGSTDHLEPQALEELYLGVFKEETKLAALRRDGDAAVEDGDSNARLQLSPPPSISTVEEASQYKHLLPQLLSRLYYQYRDHAIKEIEEDERQYRTLKEEIEELQRKERDARAQEEVPVRRDSRGISSIQHLLQHDPAGDRPVSSGRDQAIRSPQADQLEKISSTSEDKAKPAVPNGDTVGSTIPPPSTAPVPPTDPRTYSQSTLSESPSFYAAQQPAQGYAIASPKSELQRRPTLPSNQSRPNLASSPTARLHQGPLPAPDRGPSNSPIILPPPKGMRHPGSPSGALETLADMAGQQYRGRQPLPSPRSAQVPAAQHPQYPQHTTYPPRPYGYYEGQSPYTSAYSPYGQSHGSPYPPTQHQVYSPYQPSVPTPGTHPQYSSVPYPSYPQYSTYGHAPHYPQTPRPAPFAPPSYPASAQHTPITNSGRPQPPRPSPIVTSASSTKWKNVDPVSIARFGSPPRPSRDEISPISDRAPSPPPPPSAPQESSSATTGKKRDKNPRRTAAKERAAREGIDGARSSGRRGSTISRPSTRSQSITSPVPNEDSQGVFASRRAVKNEPPATPAADTADESASVLSMTADETIGARKSTRRRRETMRGMEATEAILGSTATKRKRASTHGTSADSPTSAAALPQVTSKPKLTEEKIIGARNFPRMSATIINEITSHRLAGIFAKPLTEREAPGYKDLIYRPQDLKSIKGAITAGNRALVAADSSGENNVELAANPDIVPPKGIVNSAQLEKELMRMFANAIMFNPDSKRGVGPLLEKKEVKHVPRRLEEDEADELGEADEGEVGKEREEEGGVVADTREMYEAVERSVENWRAAEDWVGTSGTPARGAGVKGEGPRLRGGEETEADEAADEQTPEIQMETPAVVTGRRRRR